MRINENISLCEPCYSRPFRSRQHLRSDCEGIQACVTCMENTMSLRLKNYGKVMYMGHRRFLPIRHRYRRWKRPFNRNTEIGVKPRRLSGIELFEKVIDVNVVLGKGQKKKE